MSRRGKGRRSYGEECTDWIAQPCHQLPAASWKQGWAQGIMRAGQLGRQTVSCGTDNGPSDYTGTCPTGFNLIKKHLSGSCFTKGRKHKNTLTLMFSRCCLISELLHEKKTVLEYLKAKVLTECLLWSKVTEDHFAGRRSRIREVKNGMGREEWSFEYLLPRTWKAWLNKVNLVMILCLTESYFSHY